MPTSPKRGGRNRATTPGKNPPLTAETESHNRSKRIHHTANRESERNSEPLEEFANRVPRSNQLPAAGKLSRSLGLVLKTAGVVRTICFSANILNQMFACFRLSSTGAPLSVSTQQGNRFSLVGGGGGGDDVSETCEKKVVRVALGIIYVCFETFYFLIFEPHFKHL